MKDFTVFLKEIIKLFQKYLKTVDKYFYIN